MPRNSKEKMLSADVDSAVVDRFFEQVESRGFVKKRALRGAIELWLSLPEGVQAHILTGECGEDVLAGVVKYIFRNRMDAIREKLESLGVRAPDTPQPASIR